MNRKTKIRHSKKALVGILLVILSGYLIYRGWLYWGERRLNFQAYEPTALPAGVRIERHEVGITRRPFQHFKVVTYYTNKGGNFGIGEEKSSPVEYAHLWTVCPTNVTNATCKTGVTPQGQSYSDQVAFDQQGKAFRETISLLKNSTRIWIDLDEDQIQRYTDTDWEKLIDSLKPVTYPHEHIEHYLYHNSGA